MRQRKKQVTRKPEPLAMTERDVHAILVALVRRARRGDADAAFVLFSGETWSTLADFSRFLREREK